MSHENVETVRRVYALRADAAGIARGDFTDVFRDYLIPEYEIVPPLAYPDTESSYRGREGTVKKPSTRWECGSRPRCLPAGDLSRDDPAVTLGRL